jgi:hypothetical protein
MARIRTIKPEFWTDEKTGTLSELAKCVFLGLLNHVDDYGVTPFTLNEWGAKILPYYSGSTPGVLQKVLEEELLPRDLITIFNFTDENGKSRQYLFITNFAKHQRIDKPSKPTLKDWKMGETPMGYAKRTGETISVTRSNTPGALPEHSGNTPGPLLDHSYLERKGKEGKGTTTPTPPKLVEPGAKMVVGGEGKGPVFDQFCLAMNVTPQELLKAGQGWLGFKSDFDAWLTSGAIPELDIWPTITATLAKYREQNPGKLPGSPRYFTPAINRAVETRKSVMPELNQTSVAVGPNGKVLAPNGKPWTIADQATHIWASDYKFWVPRKAVEEMVDDATQNGWMDVMIIDLEGIARRWLPSDLAIRLKERQDARNWVGVYLRGARIESWPVRAPVSLSITVQETFQRWAAMSNILPPQEKTLEVA